MISGGDVYNRIYKNGALMSEINITSAQNQAFYVKGKALTAHADAKLELQNNIKAKILATKNEQFEEVKQVEAPAIDHQ